jgi:endo-1,4-beta-xylanase
LSEIDHNWGMPSLKDAYSKSFEIGAAVGGELPKDLSPAEVEMIATQFGNITPENCMKPQPVEPEEGRFDFRLPDAFVAFAQAKKLNITGHCLVWHQQCPEWFFVDGSAPASREKVLRRMRNHIETVLNRYRGKIQGWDVVNEAIDDGALYIRESKWKSCVGEDYVAKAFEVAREIDPRVRLYYNDYNIELPEKRAKTVRLLKEMLSAGLKVDAVGIQGHWMLDKIPYAEIEAAIKEFAGLGLDVMITELDVDLVERNFSGANIAAKGTSTFDPYANGVPQEVLERQAQQYARLFEIFQKGPRVTRVTFWGPHDGKSWLNTWPSRRTNYPLLFDRQCQPKPAYEAVLRAAQG